MRPNDSRQRRIYPVIAAAAVRLVDRIPAFVWAGWIVAVIAGSALFALKTQPL